MHVFCSTIIPTIGRPSLAVAVWSVLNQAFPGESEVIVVNDSGQALPPADWQADERVRVVTTYKHERCVARNTGAAMARGQNLHFLDDDDLLLPGAFAAFWALSQRTDAPWLYGSYQTVDNDGTIVDVFRPGITGNLFALLVAGESIPLQCSLVSTQHFHAAGAFDPSPAIIGVEDRDLGRRMALTGEVAFTPDIVAQIRIGQVGSTTDWARIAERDRWGREKALLCQGAQARLTTSATSDRLRGRITRAHVASAVWNLKRRNLGIALSRTLAALLFAGRSLFSSGYWRGLRTKPG